MGDGAPCGSEPSPAESPPRWLTLGPRRGFDVSWAEGTFALISIAIHVMAIRIGMTGEYPVHMHKWFDSTFGIPSPTSGTTRAIIALDQGRLLDALLYNPVATIAGAFAAVFPIYLLASLIRGRALRPTPKLRRWATRLGLGGLFVTWLVKLRWVPEQYW